jgi:RIO kinase 1
MQVIRINESDIRKRIKTERRIESEVFNREVLLTIGYLMNKGLIDIVDFPISKGKEAYVFKANAGKDAKEQGYEFLAVKIYMIETSRFKHMYNYISGDPRFKTVKNRKKDIVMAWTKKEFRNLSLCWKAGVHVPEPLSFKNNVLVMQYISGEDPEDPARTLKDVGPPDPQKNFRQLIRDMRKMYRNNLVHADLSEFNILVKGSELIIIDIGQGVALDHPMAQEFLERDVDNVIRYFSKFGIKADREKILNDIRK